MSVDILHTYPDNGRFKISNETMMPDQEASFSIRLFPEGFSIGKPLEKDKLPPTAHEAMGMLYPYNRTSESFLRALDSGRIPGDLLEDVPCKYVNGCVTCDVLDYCANAPSSDEMLSPRATADTVPIIYTITLKPTSESIVKEVSSMVDEKWSYKDLLAVESKILKTAWPELQLDPNATVLQSERKPMLRSSQKLFKHLRSSKASLMDRRLRLAAAAKAMVKAGSLVNSKKVGFEVTSESLNAETNTDISSSLKSKMMGSGQLPLSPNSNVSCARGWQDSSILMAEKQLSALGKRDIVSKVDAKKDSPRFQTQNSIPQFDQEHSTTVVPVGHEEPHQVVKSEPYFDQQIGQADLQYPVQRLSQTDGDKPSWQVLSPVDTKPDDLMRKKLSAMPQKFQQAYDLSNMSSVMAQNMASVVGGSSNPAMVSSSSSVLMQCKDSLQASGAMAGGIGVSSDQMWRRRANSIPKNSAGVPGVASPGSTVNSGGMPNVNSPSTASVPSLVTVKSEGLVSMGQKREPVENFTTLISISQRHGLPKKRKIEPPLPESQKASPSWQLLLVALANPSTDDVKDPKGHRNMADSLVGGNANVRKTRFLQFQRTIPGNGMHYRRVRIRLVMCERGKDAMVEAVVQFGDDQDDEQLNSVPHHVLPTMANAHAADIFAKQFCVLLEKEGFELVDDQVQPTTVPRAGVDKQPPNRQLPNGVAIGNNHSQVSAQRSLMGSQMPTISGVNGMQGLSQMQPSSPGALAASRMPPPAVNTANRPISANYLGQSGVAASKPLAMDGTTSQLSAVQHQASSHLQRAQQMVMPTQLAQLNHNPAQQLNQQMVGNQGQLQQFLQQQQRQQTQSVLQRKMMGMGSLGPMGNLGGVGIPVSGASQGGIGNMVGAMNVGMSGINNVSASMGTMSNLNNVGQLQGMVAMGQNSGLSNLMRTQMAAFSNKAHLAQGRGGLSMTSGNPTSRENLSGLNNANQLMMNPTMNRVVGSRVGLNPMQRAAPVGSLGSPRVATSNMPTVGGQGMYMNPSQQLTSQQQYSLQQLNSLQQNGQQQQMNAQQLQLPQTQQINMQVQQQQQQQQQQNPAQSLNIQQTKNTQQALGSQTTLLSQPQQQPQSQQLSGQGQINPASQQHNSVNNLQSLVGGPASPQLSSQNAGSVTSAPPMEPSMTNCSGASLSSG